MSSPQTKADLLAAFDAARHAHLAFLAAIPRARMSEPGVTGAWSVKDILAHVAGWRGRTLDRLEAAGRGAPDPGPPWPATLEAGGDDAINDWIYEQNRDRPLDAVLADWEASFERIAGLVATLPETALFDPAYFPWMEGAPLADAMRGGFLGHFRDEHEPAIRAWLAGRTAVQGPGTRDQRPGTREQEERNP